MPNKTCTWLKTHDTEKREMREALQTKRNTIISLLLPDTLLNVAKKYHY